VQTSSLADGIGADCARKGDAIVKVGQPFKNWDFSLPTVPKPGITSPADLRGRTMDVWFSGSEYPFLAWIARRGYKIDGSPGDRVLVSIRWTSRAIASQPRRIMRIGRSTMPFDFERARRLQRVTMLEDGLYVMESQLRDSVFVKTIASFVKVSMRGWEYARQNPYGVTNIVLANGINGAEREASAAHGERN
jgi:NitT/TauT family transport system substrate-binding protein